MLNKALRIKDVNIGWKVSYRERSTIRSKDNMTDCVLTIEKCSLLGSVIAYINGRDLTVLRSAHNAHGVFWELAWTDRTTSRAEIKNFYFTKKSCSGSQTVVTCSLRQSFPSFRWWNLNFDALAYRKPQNSILNALDNLAFSQDYFHRFIKFLNDLLWRFIVTHLKRKFDTWSWKNFWSLPLLQFFLDCDLFPVNERLFDQVFSSGILLAEQGTFVLEIQSKSVISSQTLKHPCVFWRDYLSTCFICINDSLLGWVLLFLLVLTFSSSLLVMVCVIVVLTIRIDRLLHCCRYLILHLIDWNHVGFVISQRSFGIFALLLIYLATLSLNWTVPRLHLLIGSSFLLLLAAWVASLFSFSDFFFLFFSALHRLVFHCR